MLLSLSSLFRTVISSNNLSFGTLSTILLTTIIVGLYQENSYGAVKPFFPSDPKGQDCSDLFDNISDLRAKSDKQGGQLSGEDQKSLDSMVSDYNTKCRPHYGGNPRIAGETGIFGGKTGVIDPGTSPNSQSTTGEQIQKAVPIPGLKEAIPAIPKSGQSVQPQLQQATLPDHRVKVQFNSITVHNDEEGSLPYDDGEYTMRAIVNGMYVNLDKGSGGKLWDVSPGETVYFAPYTSAIVEIPSKMPLSIYTLGYEADSCPRIGYGDIPSNPNIIPILKGPKSEWLSDIRRIIDQDISGKTSGDRDCNDRIGFINKIHEWPGYEAGAHSMASTNGDDPDNPNAKPNFTLRYTIYVEPIPK